MKRSNVLSTNGQRIRVGIVGLGRSGWNIHAKTVLALRDKFELAAVTDPASDRRAEAVASSGCRAYEDFESLVNDKSIELIVVASPNSPWRSAICLRNRSKSGRMAQSFSNSAASIAETSPCTHATIRASVVS